MRIALLSPVDENISSGSPSATSSQGARVASYLRKGLEELGHDVSLFATGQAFPMSQDRRASTNARCLAQLGEVQKRANEFDVIHNHMGYWGFPLAQMTRVPVVSTLHERVDTPDGVHVLSHYDELPMVAVSRFQRRSAPQANWVGTVHHGIPMDQLKYRSHPGQYLAYCGRIVPNQRLDLAIQMAKASGVPLKIAVDGDAGDANGTSSDYFQAMIKRHVDGSFIELLGPIDETGREQFLAGALGLLYLAEEPEPFGLELIEAIACGTPILARPTGAVPELHQDGVSGFIRDSVHELAALVMKLEAFDRAKCRMHAEKYFSLAKMTQGYLEIYERLKKKEPVLATVNGTPLRPFARVNRALTPSAYSPTALMD